REWGRSPVVPPLSDPRDPRKPWQKAVWRWPRPSQKAAADRGRASALDDLHPLAVGPGRGERGIQHAQVAQAFLTRRAWRRAADDRERVLVHLLGLHARGLAQLRFEYGAVAGAALVALVTLERGHGVPAALAVHLQGVELAAEAGHALGHDVVRELEPEARRLVDALEQLAARGLVPGLDRDRLHAGAVARGVGAVHAHVVHGAPAARGVEAPCVVGAIAPAQPAGVGAQLDDPAERPLLRHCHEAARIGFVLHAVAD